MELQISHVSKTYPNGVEALKNVSMTIGSGMFGLLGPNGAGKSTLMRTIATLQKVDQGEITLNGLDVLNETYQVRQMLGYLPQAFGLYPDLNAEQMLNHIALLKGLAHPRERKEHVRFILHQTNLFEMRKRKLGTFSGGMRQRFGIAQALLGSPKLLIVDEPTAGLDPAERNRFHNILGDISENIIVILSTHIVDDVRQLCTEMAILHLGQVLVSGRTEDSLKKLEGKIWQRVIPKEELPEYETRFRVIFTRLFAGKVLIHILDEGQPEGFETAPPDLEDVYFCTIKNAEIFHA